MQSALFHLCHETEACTSPSSQTTMSSTFQESVKFDAIQNKLINLAMLVTSPLEKTTSASKSGFNFFNPGDLNLTYPLSAIEWLRVNLGQFMIAIPESLVADIGNVVKEMKSRVGNAKESPSSWFRRSVRKEDLTEMNSNGLAAYTANPEKEQVDSCLLGSHLKFLIKKIKLGLIPTPFQSLISESIGSQVPSLNETKLTSTLLGLENSRRQVIEKVSSLAVLIFQNAKVDPITPTNLARVIPVEEQAVLVMDLKNLSQLKELTAQMDKWNFAWGKILANPVIFFEVSLFFFPFLYFTAR